MFSLNPWLFINPLTVSTWIKMLIYSTLNNNTSEADQDGNEPTDNGSPDNQGEVSDGEPVGLISDVEPVDLNGDVDPVGLNVDVESVALGKDLHDEENSNQDKTGDEENSDALAPVNKAPSVGCDEESMVDDEMHDNVEKQKEAGKDTTKKRKGKPKKASNKNRNVRRTLVTVKNKVETIQEKNGGKANFLLLLEDNFSDLSSSGRKTTMNRKMIVTAGGDLREAFKNGTVSYNPEQMLVMKKGKKLAQDFLFLDEYLASKTAPSSSLQSSPAALANSLVQQLLELSSGKKGKRNKKIRKEESSSEDSDASSVIRRKRKKKNQKKKRKKNVETSSDSSSSESSDLPSDDSSDESDNDPLHGTLQKPNLKTKKKPPAKQVKARKAKHDILPVPAKKVLTPGSFPPKDDRKSKAVKNKDKAPKPVTKNTKSNKKVAAPLIDDSITESEQTATTKAKAIPSVPSEQGGESSKAIDKVTGTIEKHVDGTLPPMLKVTDWISKLPNPKTLNASQQRKVTKPADLKPKPANPKQKQKPATQRPANPKAANPIPTPVSQNPKSANPKPGTSRLPLSRQDPNLDPQPGPSGQFKNGRGSKILKESLKENLEPQKENSEYQKQSSKKPAQRKLFKDFTMSMEDIENMLDEESTPTRKKK